MEVCRMICPLLLMVGDGCIWSCWLFFCTPFSCFHINCHHLMTSSILAVCTLPLILSAASNLLRNQIDNQGCLQLLKLGVRTVWEPVLCKSTWALGVAFCRIYFSCQSRVLKLPDRKLPDRRCAFPALLLCAC